MNPTDLTRLRKTDWETLSALMTKTGRKQLRRLSETELSELGRLYRAATSDLAIAQRDFPQHELAQYLNQLVGNAHALVYRGEPLILRRIKAFYLSEFPRLYRSLAPFIGISTLLFFAPALLCYSILLMWPEAAKYLISESLISYCKDGTQWWKDLNTANQVGAAAIMTNNLRVSFLAFAGGLPFGLLTLYIMLMNGINMGAVFGLLQVYGHAKPLAEFVIGHGVLEINEILMAGASGLLMGYSLLQPGLLSRANALAQAARKAVKLLLGSSPMLVVAGLIEGFISPSDIIPWFIKAAIGIGSGIALFAYVCFVGQRSSD